MSSLTSVSISKHWKPAIKVLLGLGLLMGLTAFVDYDRLVASIVTANRQLLWVAFLLFSAQGIFESSRLKIVYASFNIGFLDGVRLFFIGMFFGNFMPGPIGADIYQVYHMHTIRPGLLTPVSLSLFLRLTGLFINILLAVIALSLGTQTLMNATSIHPDDLALPGWIVFVILSALLLMAMLIASSWGRSQLRSLYEKICGVLRGFFDLVKSFTFNQHVSLIVLGVFVVLSRVASFYILVQAFGSSIGGLDVMLIVTFTALASLVPISIGGLGVREISLTALFIAFGIAPPEAVAISLVSRCFIWILSLAGGVWLILNKTRSRANT